MSALEEAAWPDDGVPVAVVRTDEALRATSANSAWRELAGAKNFLPGTDWTALFDPSECPVVMAWLRRFSRTSRAEPIEVRGRAHEQWFELRASPGDIESHAHFVVAVVDITGYKRREAQLAFEATHDPLTGLRNRAALIEHTEKALTQLQRRQSITAVLFIDLDGFKRVNDRYGHDAGDAVLQAVARQLLAVTRPSDILARIGGDEFVVLCESLSTEQEATIIARRLDAAVRGAVPGDLDGIQLSAAVGIAFAEGREDNPTALIRRADRAMYLAKHGVRDPSDRQEVLRPLGTHIDLRAKDLRPRLLDVLVRLAVDLDEEWGKSTDADEALEWNTAGQHVRQAINILHNGRA
ncbi:MAG: GGDEF domain-containing protein [Actinomycetota bacterium]|nr:GGDEF domain-containing protein [Actinomycetota bacterium]